MALLPGSSPCLNLHGVNEVSTLNNPLNMKVQFSYIYLEMSTTMDSPSFVAVEARKFPAPTVGSFPPD